MARARSLMESIQEMAGRAPDEAGFFWSSGGAREVAEKVWQVTLFSGVVAFETRDGLVLVDSGLERLAPRMAAMLREVTAAPVHTAIFTQGHLDHAFGLRHFLLPDQPAPRVVAHRAMPERFERYRLTAGFNRAINARQFRGLPDPDEAVADWGHPAIAPDTLFEDRLTLQVGGLTFEVYHCRGETDDHCWIWCPEREVLCPGDLLINCVPNAGNPQKVQRYPWDWAAGLRRMAEKRPRHICPGHGGPVIDDPEKCRRMLVETADYLDDIVARTIAAMNDGAPPHVDIVHAVPPPHSDSPWLRPLYDEAEFIVRNVIRFYGGWWSGRPSELKPAPRDALATEVARLAGGPTALVERAKALAGDGDWRLACHLVDYALEAAPGDEAVQVAVAELYEARAAEESSLMAINLYRAAAVCARAGRPFR